MGRAGRHHQRTARQSEDRHIQRHAVCADDGAGRQDRNGHRRKPRLDWPRRARRRNAHDLRTAGREGSEDSASDLRQEQCRHRRQAGAGVDRLWWHLAGRISAAVEIEIAATPAGNDASEARPVLRLTNLSKSFGGVQALDRVGLQVGRGEVHGLLGQNGSGKSTLIKILSGFHAPDPGAQLWIDGQEISLPVAPGALREHGLSFVHQHLGLIPSITVLENLLVYDLAIADRWAINWRAEAQRARELFARYDIRLDPLAGVSRLSPVERAQLAIVRAFDWLQRTRGGEGASGLLVLDEPTPFLPAHDVDVLFRLVRDIVRAGTSVIFVSHDIDEVLEITTRATVLRDGRIAGTFDTATMDKRAIVHLIVGQHVDLESMRPPPKPRGARAATIRNLRGG